MAVTDVWQFSWTVPDLDRSVKFYVDGLGLLLRHSQTQDNAYTRRLIGYSDARIRMAQLVIPGVDHGISGHIIELVEYESPQADADNSPETYNHRVAHVAFAVDDIHAAHERVIAAGGTPVSEPVAIEEGINRGGWALYVRDPDGFTVELVQPPARPGAPTATLAGMAEEGR